MLDFTYVQKTFQNNALAFIYTVRGPLQYLLTQPHDNTIIHILDTISIIIDIFVQKDS